MEELFEKILFKAIHNNATDIHFYLKDKLKISMRQYGILEPFEIIEKDKGSKLMNFIKYKSLIDLNYRLTPQTGRFYYHLLNKDFDLRVSYLPSKDFESIVIRILNNHREFSIQDITPLDEIKDFLNVLIKKKTGLFIVCGATGSGKSTTLYTLLESFIKKGGLNIITIEDPIERRINDCIQIELNEKGGINYHDTLKQILRHDPDIILVGEIRDEITAKLCITCALTGHLVLTTLHAPNSLLALKRLLNLNLSLSDLESVLIGILSQRIKYDKSRKEVIVLGELLNEQQIKTIISDKPVNYNTFKKNALKLINDLNIKKELFEVELNEQ